ncbi:MAG TPA: hypothetical protein VFD43_10945 [Planctomycetota bacterium]|nr:hypothetical protein [Planctomycetota bacterium]
MTVVAASIVIQFALPHVALLGKNSEVPSMPVEHCLTLPAIGSVPLVVLELFKLVSRTGSSA